MSITESQLQETSQRIEAALVAFETDPQRVDELLQALMLLDWLRGQYGTSRALLDAHADRLRGYGRRVRAAAGAARESLAAEYLRASRAAVDWNRRRQACRDLLVELAEAEGARRFDSPEGQIEIRPARKLIVPRPDTPERKELADLIGEAGCWPAVGTPNATRLLRALDGDVFGEEQALRVRKLCPIHKTVRLMGHADGQRTAG